MAIKFQVLDETGGVQLTAIDDSGNVDLGNGTPSTAVSIDGTSLVRNDLKLGNTRGTPIATNHTTGSVSITSGGSFTITPASGSVGLFAVAPSSIYTESSFVLRNWGGGTVTASYTYL